MLTLTHIQDRLMTTERKEEILEKLEEGRNLYQETLDKKRFKLIQLYKNDIEAGLCLYFSQSDQILNLLSEVSDSSLKQYLHPTPEGIFYKRKTEKSIFDFPSDETIQIIKEKALKPRLKLINKMIEEFVLQEENEFINEAERFDRDWK